MSKQKNMPVSVKADPLSQFHMDEDELRLELVKAQYALRASRNIGQPTGVLVLVNGMELSGKGRAVTQLRQWVDPRLLNVEATIGSTPSQYEPIWQVHAEKLPRHGNITTYFGNWYADLIAGVLEHMQESKSTDWQTYLSEQLNVLSQYEADLKNNHTHILKCWFHINEDSLNYRLKDHVDDPKWLYKIDWTKNQEVKNFNEVAKIILSQQDDWLVIDGSKEDASSSKEASIQFCHEVLHCVQKAVVDSQHNDSQSKQIATSAKVNAAFTWADIPDKLIEVEDHDIDKPDYHKALAKKQAKFAELIRARQNSDSNNHHHVIFAFEGMDAAGKGGAIKRLVSPLDPREYQIYNIGAPTDVELQHPYLWRFWTRLPQFNTCAKQERLDRVAIFDRTWYGRVLVERIEGFASEAAWQRAYNEINRMERDLSDKGAIILKYWLAIDNEEQLERFEDRKETAHKQFKLTDDDWRNREKWHEYVQAAADMLARTNSKYAPWHVVATNDKRTARLAVLDHAIKQLQKHIKL